MNDPIGAYGRIQSAVKRYITTAFRTNSPSFERERQALLDTPGVLFQEPLVEVLNEYQAGRSLAQLTLGDLPGFTETSRQALQAIIGSGLFRDGYPLYSHQEAMLRECLSGRHAVVVTGTGSGKTESFLLPVLATIIHEATVASPWEPASSSHASWRQDALPDWSTTRNRLRGESRSAAVRALVVYPMNALVEDQLARLRASLDSDAVHQALRTHLFDNRIRFGRYNSATPVSGHPFRPGGRANARARARLGEAMRDAIAQSEQADQQLRRARDFYRESLTSADGGSLQDAKERLRQAEALRTFLPRLEPNAAEMFHRWEMQAAPPDILVTNLTMLSIMLMRHVDPAIPGDRADGQILDTTREWLASSPDHTFQLVVDELHLYRGTAGTEVAYLLRLLLDRLGLSPTSSQLRIIASSASLDPEREETFRFLGGFFGMETDEARGRFHVERGTLEMSGNGVLTSIGAATSEACAALGSELSSETVSTRVLSEAITAIQHEPDLSSTLVAAFGRPPGRPRSLDQLATEWFPSLTEERRRAAIRGLMSALAQQGGGSVRRLPRFRFHWMAKNIDGLWALPASRNGDPNRSVGRLLPDPSFAGDGERVLEVLYCECCGTQLLAGHKTAFRQTDALQAFAGGDLPGITSMAVAAAFELTVMSPKIGGLPDQYAEMRTDAEVYSELGVIWIPPAGWSPPGDEALAWMQRSEEADGQQAHAAARWAPAALDPKTGVVIVGEGPPPADALQCRWFQVLDAQADVFALPAMPQRCPNCLIDYSERKFGRPSPVRSFVTGLSRMSHLLSKHFMAALPNEPRRQLVAFSDSRESAASLAAGIANEQWNHLLRLFSLRHMRAAATESLDQAKRSILEALERGDEEDARETLRHHRERLTPDAADTLVAFARMARDYVHDPELITESERMSLEAVSELEAGYVHLDAIFRTPRTTEEGPLSPLWADFAMQGTCPAGAGIDSRSLDGGRVDWTKVFAQSRGQLMPRLKYPLDSREITWVEELGSRLRKAAWQVVSGRLLYDLEAQGVGHLSLPSGALLESPEGYTNSAFREACDSVVRILTEERRTDPVQGAYPAAGWEAYQPTGGANEGVAKRRVARYLRAVAGPAGNVAALRDAVARTLRGCGHTDHEGKWGVIRLRHLWVRLVAPGDRPWVCPRCSQVHWHASAGACARCGASLSPVPNGTLTSAAIMAAHYLASEASSPASVFRIHSEELTGQTDDQAQRQRHFRGVFIPGERVTDIGDREVLRNVDEIDLLSVTTTMEVGVDIGALVGIFQANMPPERFNYQQRAGRAGRKGQRYSAVLTYCRGQTHDRIHFDHPEVMTASDPPPPTLALHPTQSLLAERLVAKEVLRKAFFDLGVRWSQSGASPDSHGEMGLAADFSESRREALRAWLVRNEGFVAHVAAAIARGTPHDAATLMNGARGLPERLYEVAHDGEFSEPSLAHRLAEAGILPMYGMPTRVRELFYDLPTRTAGGAVPRGKSLERDFDQAVSDFVPGAERTWDKRLLRPVGLVENVAFHAGSGQWLAGGQPVGAAFGHLSCAACRRLHDVPLDAETFTPNTESRWWQPEWAASPPAAVTCPSCGSSRARAYVAIAPRAFITDLDLGRPAGASNRRRRAGVARVASPVMRETLRFHSEGGCLIGRARQGRVYRTNAGPDGRLFEFASVSQIGSGRRTVHGSIWCSAEAAATSNHRVAIVSPKTTDVLAIRASNREGVEFFDADADFASRRAAWYTAATILQRAIALELDVDSLEIEIASMHRFSDGAVSGAELYLADAHPNGSGIVDWAHSNWSALLDGCIDGDGRLNRLGVLMANEMRKSISEPWRSPDLLLRGYRNRSVHGLIGYSLGMELLATLRSSEFRPGLDVLRRSDGSVVARSFRERCEAAARRYVATFSSTILSLPEGGDVVGWRELDHPGTISVVVHPLWSAHAARRNGLGKAIEWAREQGAARIRLIDLFNLQRRISWVRSHRDLFPVLAIDP